MILKEISILSNILKVHCQISNAFSSLLPNCVLSIYAGMMVLDIEQGYRKYEERNATRYERLFSLSYSRAFPAQSDSLIRVSRKKAGWEIQSSDRFVCTWLQVNDEIVERMEEIKNNILTIR